MIKRFAVVGNPIAHSLSPLIHQAFARQVNMNLSYETIQATEETFEHCVQAFFQQGGMGLNVTSPFKEKAFRIADGVSERCQKAGAANTLWMASGQLYADNTDGIGFWRDLSRHFSITQKKVLILGAGGAVRGILPPLVTAPLAQLTLANRTLERAQALQREFPQLTCCSVESLHSSFDLIIHATSASFTGKDFFLSSTVLHPNTFCYDLVYDRQHHTPFVQWAQQHGCKAVDGWGMLLEQAAEAFFIWNGHFPQLNESFFYFRSHAGSDP